MTKNFSMEIGGGLGALAFGTFAYCLYSATKMNETRRDLEKSIDDISKNIDVNIPDAIISKAVKLAAEKEANKQVSEASKQAVDAIRGDINARVRSAIDLAYHSVKDDVKRTLEEKARNVDTRRLREEVIERAKKDASKAFESDLDEIRKDAKEKYEDEVDDILEKTNDRLDEILDGLDDDDDLLKLLLKRAVKRM